MSTYPPGGDYDERLLDSAPKATRAEKQEGYNVNLLASDNSESPMNPRPRTATADGHASLETGVPPNKEGYISSHPPVPWYRKNKWRIAMLIGAIVVIGAVVGGVVGGTVGSKNRKTTPPGQVTISLPTPTPTGPSSVSAGTPADSTAANGVSPSQLPTSAGGAASPRSTIRPTSSFAENLNLGGSTDPGRGVAAIVSYG